MPFIVLCGKMTHHIAAGDHDVQSSNFRVKVLREM